MLHVVTACVLLALIACPVAVRSQQWMPRLLGSFPQSHAAFVQLHPSLEAGVDPLDKYTLFVSDFDSLALFQTDEIWYLRSLGRNLTDVDRLQMNMIDNSHYWPNDVNYMPKEVVGTEGIIWTSGFLVPTKTEGHLSLYLTNADPPEGPYNIATLDDQHYSYHRVVWHDVNHDGFLDAVSARFHVEGSATLQQLLWFENPGVGAPTEGWMQHLVVEGPDVHFRLTTLPAGGQNFTVLVAAEFFNERLALYYAEDGSDSFLADPSKLVTLIVDDTVGQTFDVDISDLNLDGRLEILLTGYVPEDQGRVFIFELPDDFRSEPFAKHVLANGFIPNFVTGQGMSPGAPYSYYTGIEHQNSGLKPYVFVSGDDDGVHYVLTPDSEDPQNWSYTKNVLLDTQATTTGKFAIADVDNDGWNELVVAGYTAGRVWVYTYSPADE